MPIEPEIVFSIRNQMNGKNYVIPAEKDGKVYRFAKLPEKCTPQISFKNLPRGIVIKRVEITLNEDGDTEYSDPWRFGGDNAITPMFDGDYLLGATAYTQDTGGKPFIAGKRRFSVGAEVKPPRPNPKPTPKPAEDEVVVRIGVATSLDQDKAPLAKVGPHLRALGIVAVRGYYQADGWNPPGAGDGETIKRWKDGGFEVWLTITSPKRPTSVKQAEDYWKSAVKIYGPHVRALIVGNEPNLRPTYFNAPSGEYVKYCLEPASRICRDAGILIGGGAVSEDEQGIYLKELIGHGLLELIDFYDYHPYGGTSSVQRRRLLLHRGLIGSKPMVLSEWNIHGEADDLESWANQLSACFEACKAANVSTAFYYCLMRKPAGTKEYAARAALLERDFTPQQVFYNRVKLLA